MSLAAVVLVLLSVATHVWWNLLAKRQHPTSAFFLVGNFMALLWMAPLLVWLSPPLSSIPAAVWYVLVATGVAQAVYYAGLAGAYRTGDMSFAYPLARSVPPVFVLAGSVVLGRSDHISGQCILGITVLVAGGALLPMRSFRDLRLRNYANACFCLSLLSAVGTAGYSLCDDHGLRLLRATPWFGVALATIVYAVLEAISTMLILAVWVLCNARERRDLPRVLAQTKTEALLVGSGVYVSYGLALAAMAYVADVTYVVGLRQLSVPVGALLAVRLFGERMTGPKVAGLLLCTGGTVLIGTG